MPSCMVQQGLRLVMSLLSVFRGYLLIIYFCLLYFSVNAVLTYVYMLYYFNTNSDIKFRAKIGGNYMEESWQRLPYSILSNL